MFSESASSYLSKSIEKEIENAESWGKDFSSNHEAYAVLKEEVEEAGEELDKVKSILNIYWHLIRTNTYKNCMEECVKTLEDATFSTIKELIQVMAVCHKALKTIKKGE